jgi:DNA polymerase-1
MGKLLIIDGNAVLHRAYYALPDWRNRSGEATAGVYGFLSMLVKALEELKPTHLAVVFDSPEPTFRHVMYVGYQATREKERQVSEDIWGQVEKLKVIFKKMGVPVFTVPGFEADDVIGTISTQCLKLSTRVIIITGDKDLMQLVNKHTVLYMPQKGLSDGIIVDENRVMEKMGVHPEQIIDYKALVGDSSDNYPGVAGIGPKTAVQLLAEYGSLKNIYKQIRNSDSQKTKQIPNSILEKLVNGWEAATLSEQLATIRRDTPVTLDISQCAVPHAQKILEILKELGYKSLTKRLGGSVEEEDDRQEKLFN